MPVTAAHVTFAERRTKPKARSQRRKEQRGAVTLSRRGTVVRTRRDPQKGLVPPQTLSCLGPEALPCKTQCVRRQAVMCPVVTPAFRGVLPLIPAQSSCPVTPFLKRHAGA